MIIRLPASSSKLPEVLQRLRRNSVVIEQPAEVAALDLTSAGVRVAAFTVAESGKSLETQVTLRFERDRAAVLPALNPALLAILGYHPALPSVITAPAWPPQAPGTGAGELLHVALSDKLTAQQTKAIEDLEYLLDLHVVPVGIG